MNNADDKGLTEGMANILNMILSWGWHSQTIKNEFTSVFSLSFLWWPSAHSFYFMSALANPFVHDFFISHVIVSLLHRHDDFIKQ